MPLPPVRVLWRESHATSALLAALAAAVPAWLAALAVIAATERAPDWPYALRLLAGSLVASAIWGVLVAFTAHHLAPFAGAIWGALYAILVWLVARLVPHAPAFFPCVVWGAVLGPWFHLARLRERARHLADR